MLDALVAGTRDPDVLAELAKGTLRKKIPQLRDALEGRFGPHHGLLVGQILAKLDFLDEAIATLSVEIDRMIAPFEAEVALLVTIPGIERRSAQEVIAEIGVDMTRFPTAAHLAAWTGLAPGNNESAGKRRKGRHRKGNTHVQSVLIEAALAAAKTRTRIGARYHRLHRRFGGKQNPAAAKKAAFGVAHTLIKVIWSVLATGTAYTDLGHDFYTRRVDPETQTRRLVAQLEALSGKKIVFVDDGGDPAAA
jgi:transposase